MRRHTENGCPKRFELGFREDTGASLARGSVKDLPALDQSDVTGTLSLPPPLPPLPPLVFAPKFPKEEAEGRGEGGMIWGEGGDDGIQWAFGPEKWSEELGDEN